MHSVKRIAISLVLVSLLLAALCFLFVLPSARTVVSDLRAYDTQEARRTDYKLNTSPLPGNTVMDLCSSLGIAASFPKCHSNGNVYAPEFFGPIKTYFANVPSENQTYAFVQDKLGRYQVECEPPNSDGDYRCMYDLLGDGLYPFAFYFHKDGHYFMIIADVDHS